MNSNSDPNDFMIHYLKNKAGTEEANLDKIKEVIFDTTKDSFYYKKKKEQQLQCEAKSKEIVKEYQNSLKDQNRIIALKKLIEREVNNASDNMNLEKIWAHFDLDMFYAAIEIRFKF